MTLIKHCIDILCALLFVVAIFGTAILLLHREYSRQLQLTTEPGTLAASIALGASDVSYLLNGKDTKEDMRTMLADLQFTIDPVSVVPTRILASSHSFLTITVVNHSKPDVWSCRRVRGVTPSSLEHTFRDQRDFRGHQLEPTLARTSRPLTSKKSSRFENLHPKTGRWLHTLITTHFTRPLVKHSLTGYWF